jgi:hypothetical protein
MTDTVTVGSFFECSWGYDQTNVDFYKVLSLTPSGKTVKVQRWASVGDASGRVRPGDRPASFPRWVDRQMVGTVDAPVMTKRLRASYRGVPSFFVESYADAYLWDGQDAWQTPAGAGH